MSDACELADRSLVQRLIWMLGPQKERIVFERSVGGDEGRTGCYLDWGVSQSRCWLKSRHDRLGRPLNDLFRLECGAVSCSGPGTVFWLHVRNFFFFNNFYLKRNDKSF